MSPKAPEKEERLESTDDNTEFTEIDIEDENLEAVYTWRKKHRAHRQKSTAQNVLRLDCVKRGTGNQINDNIVCLTCIADSPENHVIPDLLREKHSNLVAETSWKPLAFSSEFDPGLLNADGPPDEIYKHFTMREVADRCRSIALLLSRSHELTISSRYYMVTQFCKIGVWDWYPLENKLYWNRSATVVLPNAIAQVHNFNTLH